MVVVPSTKWGLIFLILSPSCWDFLTHHNAFWTKSRSKWETDLCSIPNKNRNNKHLYNFNYILDIIITHLILSKLHEVIVSIFQKGGWSRERSNELLKPSLLTIKELLCTFQWTWLFFHPNSALKHSTDQQLCLKKKKHYWGYEEVNYKDN